MTCASLCSRCTAMAMMCAHCVGAKGGGNERAQGGKGNTDSEGWQACVGLCGRHGRDVCTLCEQGVREARGKGRIQNVRALQLLLLLLLL